MISQMDIFYRGIVKNYDSGSGEINLPDGSSMTMCVDGRALIHSEHNLTQLPIREGNAEIQKRWMELLPLLEGVDCFDIGAQAARFLEKSDKKYIVGNEGRFAQLVTRRETYSLWFLYADVSKRYFLFDKARGGVVCDKVTLPYVKELMGACPYFAHNLTELEAQNVLKRFIEIVPPDIAVKELLSYIKWK